MTSHSPMRRSSFVPCFTLLPGFDFKKQTQHGEVSTSEAYFDQMQHILESLFVENTDSNRQRGVCASADNALFRGQ